MINHAKYSAGWRPCAVCKVEEIRSELYYIEGYHLCPECTLKYVGRIKGLLPLTNPERNKIITEMQKEWGEATKWT